MKHKLSKIVSDLQEGSRGVARAQAEVDFLEEQIAGLVPNSSAATQVAKIKQSLSNLFREHLGDYNPDSGPIIGPTDVIGDMALDSVTSGGQAGSAGSGGSATDDVALRAELKDVKATAELFAGVLAEISTSLQKATG